MRSSLVIGLAGISLLWSTAAAATCPEYYEVNQWVEAMNAADQAIGSAEIDAARATLTGVEAKLVCVPVVVHPNHLTRFARQKALLAFFDQDELTAGRWGALSKIAGTAAWPDDMDETHPFREMIEMADDPPRSGPEGAGLYVPKGRSVFMNGAFLAMPVAPVEVPNLVQVFDKDGLLVEGFWQDGAAFPTRFLAADPTPMEPPSWFSDPDPALDPFKPIQVDAEAAAARQARMAESQAEAEAEKARQAALRESELDRTEKFAKRAAKIRENERKAEDKRIAKAERKLMRAEGTLDPDAPPPPPEEWLSLSFDDERTELMVFEDLDKVVVTVSCDEYIRLEPAALMGKLDTETIRCLEVKLRHSPRQTDRDTVSRILMADAWAKDEPHRWEATVRRHLLDIDRSDSDLSYIFARYLAHKGPEYAGEAIRWAEVALERSNKWAGPTYTKRRYALLRIKALAAQQKWYQLEDEFKNDSSRELLSRANVWRNRTKTYAREWLEFSMKSGLDMETPKQMCISAAGTRQFCDMG